MENSLKTINHGAELDNLEPASVWKIFKEISAIPRGSEHEEGAMQFLTKWAEERDFLCLRDSAGNLCIKVPGSKGCENLDSVCLQGHIDMVTVKSDESDHDFSADPIEIYQDGNFVKAKDTTLGADNGIGVSSALAIVEDPETVHPPLEILITVREEIGLKGAKALDPNALDLKSSTMINVDCEGVGKLTISSAGSFDVEAKQNIFREDIDANKGQFLEINISDLPGGHSGTEINDNRGNAIISMGELLKQLPSEVKLVSLNGGQARNSIPSSSSALVYVPNNGLLPSMYEVFQKHAQQLQAQWKEARICISTYFKNTPTVNMGCMLDDFKEKIIEALTTVPNGVVAMNPDISDMVQTSTNLGVVKTQYASCQLDFFIRSSIYHEMEELRDKISAILTTLGFHSEVVAESDEWVGDIHCDSVQKGLEAYKNTTGKDAELIGIHAGLEIGILTDKLSQYFGKKADGFSFGPEIKDAHSLKERVDIESVKIFYEHLKETLRLMTVR